MKKIPYAFRAIVASLLLIAASPGFQMISVEEVSKKLGSANFFVYDANTEEVFAKNHVPGAKFLSFRYSKTELPQNSAATLVFYCKNPQCTASHWAAKRAVEFGYRNVFVMGDGIEGWIAAKQPTEPKP